jgi:hypothetical protein
VTAIDLDDVAAGIKKALETIPSLTGRAFSEIPERVSPPTAVVVLGSGDWETFDDAERVNWQILLLVSLANAKNAQQRLRDFLKRTGTESVKAALEADGTLGGTVADLNAGPWNEPDTYEIGDQQYLGVVVNLATYG